MKGKLENREDIKFLVDVFYEKVKQDPLIGYIFTDLMKVNWERHLPRIYDFQLDYAGNTNSPLFSQ